MSIQRVSNNNLAFGLKLKAGTNLADAKNYGFTSEKFLKQMNQIEEKVQDIAPYNRTIFLDFEKDVIEEHYRWILKAFLQDKETKVNISMLSKPKEVETFLDASVPVGKIEQEVEKLGRKMNIGDA